jgi:hypothetical protein
MKNTGTFDINLDDYSWKEKARQFEALLNVLV